MSTLQISRALSLPPSIRASLFQRAALLSPTHTSRVSPTPRSFATTRHHYAPNTPGEAPSSSSVNHDEVSHFNALASSWWDPHGSSRLLHLMNPLRHDFIRQCLSTHTRDESKKLRHLDIGCGGGIFAESAARLASTEAVTAIDPTPEVIRVAKRHQRLDPLLLEKGRLQYENMAVEDLPRTADGYDIVTLFEVVEHIRKPAPFLQTCLQHVKPGGWFIGSTIARSNMSWFTTKFIAEDVLGLVPRGTHDWNQYIQPDELRAWARVQPQLDVEWNGWQIMGVVYVPGLGWKEVPQSETWGNYFFGMRKKALEI